MPRYKKVDNQLTIFDLIKDYSTPAPFAPGQFRIIEALRHEMREAIKHCALSRHQIAGEMSHLLNETITKEQIDSWTREDQRAEIGDERLGEEDRWIRRHIPGEYLPAFCEVTGSTGPLKVMGTPCRVFFLPGPEALRAEIQRLDEEIRKAQARKKKRMIFLKEIEGDTSTRSG